MSSSTAVSVGLANSGSCWSGSVGGLLVATSILAGMPPAAAAVHPLDVPGPNSDVIDQPASMAPKLDPFGKWVVYLADSELDGKFELWSAPLAGGAPIRLSAGMQVGDQLGPFEISADGTFVAFLWAVAPTLAELYVVPIDGGTPVKKNHLLGDGESVDRLEISADSQWLVYRARVEDGSFQLFGVEVSGSSPAKYDYTIPYPCTATVDDFVLAPDSTQVAFRVVLNDCPDENYPGDSLYSAQIGDSEADLIIETLVDGVVPQFQFVTPTLTGAARLIFISDLDSYDNPKYQTVLQWRDGTTIGPQNVISGAMVTGANVMSFVPVPFTDHVVFRADREVDNHFELWRNTVGLPFAQAPVQLHEQLPTDVTHLFDVTWDGARVVFVQESELIGGALAHLRSASVASPGATTLLQSISFPGRVAQLEIAGDDVVFLADRDVPDRLELFAVPASGGTVARMNPIANPLFVEWDVLNLAIAPDGSRVHFAYQSELLTMPFSVVAEVRSAPIPGGGSVAYGPSLDAGGTGARFYDLLAPLDERWAVSLGDATIAGRLQLYVSDACLFCDSFEGNGDGRSRWD